ncbi:MAG TPA: ABC transporter permease [Chloroflexota bacterium]|nr:ABC transporter permease [Chloroflexota bacterium]
MSQVIGVDTDDVLFEDGTVIQPTRWAQRHYRLYLLLRTPSALVGLFILLVLLVATIIGPRLAPYDPYYQNFLAELAPPSHAHLFGTDEYGRDIFSRVLYGVRSALAAGIVANGIAMLVGAFIGLIAGYYGRWVDGLLMRTTDVMLAFPYLLLALIVVSILGPGIESAVIAIGIVYAPQFARLTRGSVLEAREHDYVDAARALGVSGPRMMWRHILPAVMPAVSVMATLTVGLAIVETAGLSFLGLGAQPPAADWGAMLADGRNYMLSAQWVATFPGMAILFTALGFNLLGDALRDVLDPRLVR